MPRVRTLRSSGYPSNGKNSFASAFLAKSAYRESSILDPRQIVADFGQHQQPAAKVPKFSAGASFKAAVQKAKI